MLATFDQKQNNVQVSSISSLVYTKAHDLENNEETPGFDSVTQLVQTNSPASFSIGEDRAALSRHFFADEYGRFF